MKHLFLLNDLPYGAETSYNELRLALALANKEPEARGVVFLVIDAVACARRGQQTPDGYHNIVRMLKRFASASHKILFCRTCMDARGHAEADLTDRAQRCTIDEPAAELIDPNKVIVF